MPNARRSNFIFPFIIPLEHRFSVGGAIKISFSALPHFGGSLHDSYSLILFAIFVSSRVIALSSATSHSHRACSFFLSFLQVSLATLVSERSLVCLFVRRFCSAIS